MRDGFSGLSYEMLLAAALALAASCDLALNRIPNWLTVLIAVSGLAARAVTTGFLAAGSSVAAALLIGALLAPFWLRRMLGAGDLKLAAAAGTWVGLGRTPQLLLATTIAGGVVSLIVYLRSGAQARSRTRANLLQLHAPSLPYAGCERTRAVVPYGLAIAAGAAFAVWG